jgi:heme-degrading monooxygenase HmoA
VVYLYIIKYKWFTCPLAFFAMAWMRLPLWLNRHLSFYKLMGAGKGGSFSKTPDVLTWSILVCSKENYDSKNLGVIINTWHKLLGCEVSYVQLQPFKGHGTWNGKKPFNYINTAPTGRVAVLTRASIRPSKLKYFWQHVAPVASTLNQTPGFIQSIGIGELPWIKQATFSIWENEEAIKQFAYTQHQHKQVVKLTREQNWYSEDLFARFEIISTKGNWLKQA